MLTTRHSVKQQESTLKSPKKLFLIALTGDLSYTQIKIKSEVVKAEAEARNCDQYSDQCDQNTIFNNIENVTLQRMDFKALSVQWIPNFKSDFIYTY